MLVTTPVHLRRMAATEGLAQAGVGLPRASSPRAGRWRPRPRRRLREQLGAAPIEILGSTETGGVAVAGSARGGEISSGRCPACASSSSPPDDGPGRDLALRERRPRHPHRRASLPDGRPRTSSLPDGSFRAARALRSHRQDRGEAALASRDGEGSGPAPGGLARWRCWCCRAPREQRVHAAVVLSEIGREILIREGRRALGRALAAHLWRCAGTRCCCRASGATSTRCRETPQGKLPRGFARRALRAARPRRRCCRRRRAARAGSSGGSRCPRDLAYLDGHYDGQPRRRPRSPSCAG